VVLSQIRQEPLFDLFKVLMLKRIKFFDAVKVPNCRKGVHCMLSVSGPQRQRHLFCVNECMNFFYTVGERTGLVLEG
jgi:hypothetical protein